jgi:hypothetical protein
LPALIASGKPGRPIRIATSEETQREIEAAERLGARFIGINEPLFNFQKDHTNARPSVSTKAFHHLFRVAFLSGAFGEHE